jgi:uncharacterized protein (TIGR02246 family)
VRLLYWAAAGLLIVATTGWRPSGTGSRPETSQTVERDKAAINKTRNEYVSAWKTADAALIAGLYTDDALVLYPNQPAVEGKGILGYFKSFFGEFPQNDFDLTSAEIEIVGPWAFDRGSYKWKGVPRVGGEALLDHRKYLVILRRQADGSWKVFRDVDNSDRPVTQAARGAG